MDPKEALRIINSKTECKAYRAECIEALAAWINNGGFMPCGEEGEEMHPTLTDYAVDSMESEGLKELAQSLRVALAYGDHSGLEFHIG